MEKIDRKTALMEWNEILREHPMIARALLAQQAILIESSIHGFKLVDQSMSLLLESGLPVLFEDFWNHKVKGEISLETLHGVEKELAQGLIGCLTDSNRDPARCFGSEDDLRWFQDPFVGGKVLPSKPPIPPMK